VLLKERAANAVNTIDAFKVVRLFMTLTNRRIGALGLWSMALTTMPHPDVGHPVQRSGAFRFRIKYDCKRRIRFQNPQLGSM
jgi:hypothetical protein